jgi:hypothetical protein
MRSSRIVATCLALAMVALVGACASAPKGPSDQELIDKLLGDWQAAVLSKNLDQMMAITSDSFSSAEAADKAAWKSYLQWVISSGYLDGAQVDAAKAQTTLEGDRATVGPVVLTTPAGVFNLQLTLAKEEGSWKVVSQRAT